MRIDREARGYLSYIQQHTLNPGKTTCCFDRHRSVPWTVFATVAISARFLFFLSDVVVIDQIE